MSASLATISLFSTMKDDDRELLGSYGHFMPVAEGQVLIEEGAEQPYLYCVTSGELDVRRNSEAGVYVIASLFPGDSIGEMAIFDLAPASATVVARQFSQVWQISYEELMQFIADNPGAAVKILLTILGLMARRLRQADPATFRFSERSE